MERGASEVIVELEHILLNQTHKLMVAESRIETWRVLTRYRYSWL